MPSFRDFTTDASKMETLLHKNVKKLEDDFPVELAELKAAVDAARLRVNVLSSDPSADAELDAFVEQVFRPALRKLNGKNYEFRLLQDRVRLMREVMQGQEYADALATCDELSLLKRVLDDARSKYDANVIREMLAQLTPGKSSRWGATHLLSVDIKVGVLACVELDQESFVGYNRTNAHNPLQPCTVLEILDKPIFGRVYVVALLAGESVEYRLVNARELFVIG